MLEPMIYTQGRPARHDDRVSMCGERFPAIRALSRDFQYLHLAHGLLAWSGMALIGRDASASLAALCLILLACGSSDHLDGERAPWIEFPKDECADDAPPAQQSLPSACQTLSGTTPDEVIGTDDGWLLVRLHLEGTFAPGRASVMTESLAPDAASLTTTSVDIGERSLFSEERGFLTSSFALVGDVLVVAVGLDLIAVDARGAGPSFRNLANDVPHAVRLVALDSTRVAAFGIDRAELGAAAKPMVRIHDVVSGATVATHVYDFGVAATWYPVILWNIPTLPALAVARTDTDRLLVAWVTESQRAIQAIQVDANGEPLDQPTTLTTATTDLFTPQLARISDTEIGMVWTGRSGLEVRYRSLPVDLAGVRPENGVIVNATRRCSQEFARIASAPEGGALVVWGTETPGPIRGRWIGAGAPVTLGPASSDLSPAATCSVDSFMATFLASGPHGLLLVWDETGFSGGPVTMLTTVSR